MKKNKLVLLITLVIIATACSYTKNVRLLLGGKLKREAFVQTLPFEYRKGLIIVKARLNSDTILHEFIFDTGAFNSKVAHSLANELNLPTVTTKSNSTAQGNTRTIEVTRIDSLQLGETVFYDIGAGKVMYDEKSASPCIAAGGIIGANLIKLAHWKIDYQSQQISFSDKPFEPDTVTPVYRFPFERPLLSGVPKVNLEIEGKQVEGMLFDVGFNGGIILPASLAGNFSLENETRTIFDQSTTGIYGSNIDTLLCKKLSVSLGGHRATIPITFSSIGKALIGNEYLSQFDVFIDYEANEIILQPVREVDIATEIAFVPGVLNDSLWIVNRTLQGSLLQLDDTLKAVNGYKPRDLFQSHCDYVMNIGSFLKGDSISVQRLDGEVFVLP